MPGMLQKSPALVPRYYKFESIFPIEESGANRTLSEVTSTTGKALFHLRFRKLPMAPGMRCRTGFPTLQHFHQRDK